MEPQAQQSNFLTIPLAIVVAGIVIAGAIFFGGRGGGTATNNQPTNTQPAAVAVVLRQVSAEDHIRGNPDATITLVEYSDTECPFCKAFHGTMQKLMDEYGKNGSLAWGYRHFPLDQLHPVKARKEAESAECAGEIGGNIAFWSYLDRIFEITPSNNGLDPAELPKIATLLKLDEKKFNACVASGKYAEKIQRDYDDGASAGANGTPFSILVLKKEVTKTQETALAPLIAQYRGGVALSQDKTKITLNGALPYESIKTILDILLK